MTMTDDDTTTDSLADLATEDDEVALPGKRCHVVLEDGTRMTVRITNRDYIAWDMTAPKHRWGKAGDVPFLAGTFMAWTAAKREGQTRLTWEQWKAAVVDLDNNADDVEDPVRPTQRAARPATS